MKSRLLLTTLFTLTVLLTTRADDIGTAPTNKAPTVVACVGDSITQGVGVKDPKKDAWPAQLARLLGEGWDVRNFGVSGTTLMQKGDRPYQKRPQFQAALDAKPDVVIIALGTNDSKPQNIDTNPDDFLPSHRDLISKFRAANPNARIYVCLPPPAFPELFGIRESVISERIIPLIRQVAREEKLEVIDLHTALSGRADCFPDKVHPNEAGAALIAETIHRALTAEKTRSPAS
ncbi:MAG TPA: hypothetical protein GYA07_06985 [Verrucomicrobia bacterium]|nr:hypothetical protein [Verrucomicrobiota bacterium]HOP97441.1 GDSL-type esterase/lipase family protein [Verrucomicrobiota bacterium]